MYGIHVTVSCKNTNQQLQLIFTNHSLDSKPRPGSGTSSESGDRWFVVLRYSNTCFAFVFSFYFIGK